MSVFIILTLGQLFYLIQVLFFLQKEHNPVTFLTTIQANHYLDLKVNVK